MEGNFYYQIKKRPGVLPCFHPRRSLFLTCSSHTNKPYHLQSQVGILLSATLITAPFTLQPKLSAKSDVYL
jgi:hypothetical protein